MKLMNKIQNQKTNNPLDQLVSKKQNGGNKFKDILDVETDNKSTQFENKPKDKIKNEKNEYKKEDKKETKQTDNKNKIENEEDDKTDEKTVVNKNVYMLLSQLLDIPMEELKEMDLESIMDKLGIQLDMNFDLENLDLENVDKELLNNLLLEMDLDVDELQNDEDFVAKLADKLNEKITATEDKGNNEDKMTLVSDKDSSKIKKEKVETVDNKSVKSEESEMEVEKIEVNQEETENMNDEFSNDDTKNVKGKNDKQVENKNSDQLVEDGEIETDAEPIRFDTIVRRENNLLLDAEGNVVENLEEVDQQDIIEQITSKMEFNISDENQEVRINLKPDYLGEMVMNLEVTKGELAAKITVDNYKTKEILEANLMTLQEELEDTGMEIKSFEVFVGQDSDFERDGQERFNFFNHNESLKKKNNRNKLNDISIDYEAATIEEDRNTNRIIDGTMDLQA